MTNALVSKQQPSLLTIVACRKLGLRRRRLSATFCLALTVFGTGLFTPQAGAQSRWQKIKMQLLEQACKGGDQNACQQLAKMNQKQVQPARPRSAAPPPGQQTPGSAGAETQSAPVTAAAQGGSGGSQSAAAWTPPTEETTPAKPAGPLDPMKLPEIQGIHPGITVQQANQIMARLAPGSKLIWYNQPMLMPTTNITVGHAAGVLQLPYDWIDLGGINNKDSKLNLLLEATRPPDQERIWHIALQAKYQQINRAVLLAALRKKYGKELAATLEYGQPTTDDNQVYHLWWVFDEQGRPMSPAMVNGTPEGCDYPGDQDTAPPTKPNCMWVGVHAIIEDGTGIVNNYKLALWDAPLSAREEKVTDAWLNAQLEKARQRALQKSKEAKPSL